MPFNILFDGLSVDWFYQGFILVGSEYDFPQISRFFPTQQFSYTIMKYGELLSLAEELITSYNPNIMTPDSHSQTFLCCHPTLEQTELVFLKQVFYGVNRYEQFLSAFTTVLLRLYPSQAHRSDLTLYHIFLYIICFRFEELPFAELKKFIHSQSAVKMNVLFDLLFDVEKLRKEVRGEWGKCLDLGFVDDVVIGGIEGRVGAMAEVLANVCERATGKKSGLLANIETSMGIETTTYLKKETKKQLTTPEPFNLTKPKVKLIPEPEVIEVGIKAKPAPAPGKNSKEIEAEKEKRRDEIRENVKKYYDEHQKEFELKTKQRPTNLEKVKKEVEETRKNEIKQRTFAKPLPKFSQVQTRLNVAAILREQKNLQLKILQQQRRLKALELNQRDESEFVSWQNDIKARDKYESLQNQQRRKIEMELARQAAMKSYQDNVEEKRQLVQAMHEIATELRQEREDIERETLEEKKKIIEEVQEGKENAMIEREKVVERNKRMRDEGKQEMRRILDKKKEEDEVEMKKKKQLIREIRELEKIPKAKPKVLNVAETMGFGLLQEMSLQQLRERLVQAQQSRKQEEEEKRAENNKRKSQFARTLSEKMDKIMNHRAQNSKIRQQERLRKKKQVQDERQRIEQVKLKSQQQFKKRQALKMQQKRQDQQKLNKQLKQIQQRRQFMNENQAAVENNAFKNQQYGAERQILQRQNTRLISREKAQSIRMKQMKVIADKAKRQVQDKVFLKLNQIDFAKLYDQNREQSNKVKQMMEFDDNEAKATKFQATKQYEQRHSQNMTMLNQYKSRISELNLTRARATLEMRKK